MDIELLNRKIREILALHVTSTCNLACSECIMQWQMNDNFTYHMSIEEIERFIHFTKLSNYKFQRLTISGGEPFLWKNLDEGLKLLMNSGVTNEITVFTNAVFYKKLTPSIIKNITTIRVSYYDHLQGGTDNTEHIKELQKIHPKVEVVPRDVFTRIPSEPIHSTEEVRCKNLYTQYYNGNIYACAHAHSLALKVGSKIKTGEPIGINYLDNTVEIRKGQHTDLCSVCVSNASISSKFTKTKNINGSRLDQIKQLKSTQEILKERSESIKSQNLTDTL